MNAINFIKEHGIDKAREVVGGAPKYSKHVIPCLDGEMYFAQREDGTWFKYSNGYGKWLEYFGKCNPLDLAYDLSDLKRLVDSVDLVDSYGGIDSCRNSIYMLHELTEDPEPIRQAIADFEKIFGGEHV